MMTVAASAGTMTTRLVLVGSCQLHVSAVRSSRGRGKTGPGTGRLARTRGAMLLEVILSMGLLLFGMVTVGLQIQTGLDMARSSDVATRAIMLADTKLSELDAGLVVPELHDEELKGDFGILYPGFTWYAEVEETDIEDFYMITLKIAYNKDLAKDQIDDPDYEIDFEDEGTRTIRTVYRLWARPAEVDLQRDFGLGDEEMDKFLEELDSVGDEQMQNALNQAGLGDLAEGAGESLGDVIRDLLMLTDTGGFDPRLLAQLLTEEQFMMVAGLLETAFGRGGADAVERLGDRLPGGGGRRGGRGNRPGREGGVDGGEGNFPEPGGPPARGDGRKRRPEGADGGQVLP